MNVETCLNFRKELMHQRDVTMELLGALDAFAEGRFATWDLRVKELLAVGATAPGGAEPPESERGLDFYKKTGPEPTKGLQLTIQAEALNPVFQEVRVEGFKRLDGEKTRRTDTHGVPSVVRSWLEQRRLKGLLEFRADEAVEFVHRAMPGIAWEQKRTAVKNVLYRLKEAKVIRLAGLDAKGGEYVLEANGAIAVGKKSDQGHGGTSPSREKARQESRPTSERNGSRVERDPTGSRVKVELPSEPAGGGKNGEHLSETERKYREFRSSIEVKAGGVEA